MTQKHRHGDWHGWRLDVYMGGDTENPENAWWERDYYSNERWAQEALHDWQQVGRTVRLVEVCSTGYRNAVVRCPAHPGIGNRGAP